MGLVRVVYLQQEITTYAREEALTHAMPRLRELKRSSRDTIVKYEVRPQHLLIDMAWRNPSIGGAISCVACLGPGGASGLGNIETIQVRWV